MLLNKYEIKFAQDCLGVQSNNKDLHREYIASKAENPETIEDEVAAVGVDSVMDKALLVFPRVDGKPFVYDYQFKGFLKEACGALARVPGTRSNKLKAYRKVITGLIFPTERKMIFDMAGPLGSLTRTMRGDTAQGPRVTILTSEVVPEGSTFIVPIKLYDDTHEKLLHEWLDYGADFGLLGWRGARFGRFTWKQLS
jgi:hypothetical protein